MKVNVKIAIEVVEQAVVVHQVVVAVVHQAEVQPEGQAEVIKIDKSYTNS